jgi:hypothetical protein
MAKVITQILPPDHPIYQEGYTISSGRFNTEFSGVLTPQQDEQIRRIMEQQFEESGDCPED